MIEILIGIVRTWGHILLGIGILWLVILFAHWFCDVVDQIERARNNGNYPKYRAPKEPWKYRQ